MTKKELTEALNKTRARSRMLSVRLSQDELDLLYTTAKNERIPAAAIVRVLVTEGLKVLSA
jgi:hypothetical protein